MTKLSTAQTALLRRIQRCPKGCYVEFSERRTAGKLVALGLITLGASGRLAYPVEEGK